MPTRSPRSLLFAALTAAGVIINSPHARAAEPPPGVATTPVTSPQQAFDRLAEVTSAFAKIVDRVDAEIGRKDTPPKLFVTFGWVSRWKGPWPGDFAPREEFLKLNERVFTEAAAHALPTAFAQIAKSDSMRLPETVPGAAPALDITALRGLFEMHEFAFNRDLAAGRSLQAAETAAAQLGVARLLTGGTGSASQLGTSESRRAATVLLPLIVGGSIDAKARAQLAAALVPIRIDRAERIAREVDYLVRGVKHSLANAPADAKAWESLDATAKVTLSSFVGNKPAFPLPTADAMTAEVRAAGERMKPWSSLPIMEIRERAAQLTKSAKTPSEAREEGLLLALARALQGTDEATLAVDAVRVALALEAFRDAGGEYPASLAELVPKHLPSVPTDPGKPGEPLLYRRGSATFWGKAYPYVLYSRGSDGVDDHATPPRDPSLSLSGISTEKGKDVILSAQHQQ